MIAVTFLLPLLVAQPADAPKKPAADRYEIRKDHDPDGIGKFYMGREIAHVSGGPGWLDRPEREKEEATSKLLPPLKIKAGDTVVDLGAGSGYYTMRLAKLVGAQGKVLAVDVQADMLDIIKSKVKKAKVENVEMIQCTESDPKLPKAAVDLILMVDVYHELAHPYEVAQKMVDSLKPGGRLVFVEYRLEDDNVPIKLVHKMTEKQVIKEMEPFALRHVETQEHLPWQHVIIFEKKK
jgi:ubiquinone/menaquinone biosynthesis C-methylase UbiE